jgi:hypothetical protein
MSEWILSEQRWTSTRNWVQRTLKLALFCFLFSGRCRQNLLGLSEKLRSLPASGYLRS